MEVKVIHIKRIIGLLLFAIPISYGLWGSLYCIHHPNVQEQGLTGILAVLGAIVAGIIVILILAFICYGIKELFDWLDKDHDDDNTLFVLKKPTMPNLEPAKDIARVAPAPKTAIDVEEE